jgi:ribonuclease P protein subunit RPR2
LGMGTFEKARMRPPRNILAGMLPDPWSRATALSHFLGVHHGHFLTSTSSPISIVVASYAGMASKTVPKAKKVIHPHIHARLAFLQKAAQVLEEQQKKAAACSDPQKDSKHAVANPLARELSSQTLTITRKTKIRISKDIKRTICKGCTSKLIEGHNSVSRTENRSRDGRKAWADVRVVTCLSCGLEKRIPTGQAQGTKKSQRNPKASSDQTQIAIRNG